MLKLGEALPGLEIKFLSGPTLSVWSGKHLFIKHLFFPPSCKRSFSPLKSQTPNPHPRQLRMANKPQPPTWLPAALIFLCGFCTYLNLFFSCCSVLYQFTSQRAWNSRVKNFSPQQLVSRAGATLLTDHCLLQGYGSWEILASPIGMAEGKNSYHVSLLDLCLRVQWKLEWCESFFSFSKFRLVGKHICETSSLGIATVVKIYYEYSWFFWVLFIFIF